MATKVFMYRITADRVEWRRLKAYEEPQNLNSLAKFLDKLKGEGWTITHVTSSDIRDSLIYTIIAEKPD